MFRLWRRTTRTTTATSTTSSMAGRQQDDDEERPVRNMVNSWLFCIMIPAAALAWTSTKRWSAVLGATLAVPTLAILQGALGILSYRIYFGDAPIPLLPSHGVVVVKQLKDGDREKKKAGDTVRSNGGEHLRQRTSGMESLSPASLGGCECTPRVTSGTAAHDLLLLQDPAIQESPIRLLVIGDSLAIGVGQAKSCTPVMPEVIAKSLSKQLGRVVYWTCHGAPGASTGWIVRELERGVDYLTNERDADADEQQELDSLAVQSSCSETDGESTSDESSAADEIHVCTGAVRQDQTLLGPMSVWKEQLTQHRRRFNNPEKVLGPYDIVVVLTGSNDLKSAFFPFLLTGEDAEFRRQAKERGGSYTMELRRLLETLNSRMRLRLQSLRESVEAATESMREKVEETIELIAPGSSNHLTFRRASSRLSPSRKAPQPEHTATTSSEHLGHDGHFPLVVLPGLPASALPIFQSIPLRWLSVPIVEIMDMHKRNLARSHPGEVLYIEAPSMDDLAKYENEEGEIWQERCQEDCLLALRDIRKRDCRRIERDMREYYQRKGASSGKRGWLPPARGASVFSIDRIHPNERGYDFWGRHIARAIIREWHDKNQM